jgi:hypothetical protein
MLPRIIVAVLWIYLGRKAMHQAEEYNDIPVLPCDSCGIRMKEYKLFNLAGRQICNPCREFWLPVKENEGRLPAILG